MVNPNNLLDGTGASAPDYPFPLPSLKLEIIKARNGRYMGSLCNCCKTNKMPRGHYYCDHCKGFLSKLIHHHKQRAHNLWHNNNYYRGKYEMIKEELNRLKMQQGLPIGQKIY